MNKNISIVIILGAVLALSGGSVAADSPRTADRSPVGAPQHEFGIEIDPMTSIVRILPTRSRDVINPSFRMVSAICIDCGACPSLGRTIQVTLEATEAVAAGYGVSDLSVTNFSSGDVTYSTQDALSADPPAPDQVTITFTGSVLSCGRTFKLRFSMCDFEPADPAGACTQPVDTFTFTDTTSGPGDTGPPNSLMVFMQGVQPTVTPGHFIFVEVFRGTAAGPPFPGAWCAERADVYVNQYIAYGAGNSTWYSSGILKWWRAEGAAWSGPTGTGYTNYYGSACSTQYSWCSEWYLGGRTLGPFMPNFSGDCFGNGACTGTGEVVTIQIAPTRLGACGF